MSIAKVEYTKKARKDQGKCEKCGTPLPVGSAYRYFYVGFRSNWKHVRCMAAACAPKQSELESSKLAQVYAAMEDFEENLDGYSDWDEIQSGLADLAQSVRDVAEEYREASEDENGNVFNTMAEERAEALDSAADEFEDIDVEDEAECETCEGNGEVEAHDEDGSDIMVECPDCDGTGHDIEAMREAARSAIYDVDLGC